MFAPRLPVEEHAPPVSRRDAMVVHGLDVGDAIHLARRCIFARHRDSGDDAAEGLAIEALHDEHGRCPTLHCQ